MRGVETLNRDTYAVWDSRLGVVADVTKLTRDRWAVEGYYDGVIAYFRTRSQAFNYAMMLPFSETAS